MMNDIYLLDQIIDNLENECYQLNQELNNVNESTNVSTDKIMSDSNNMFNPYPTPEDAPMDFDENLLNNLSSYNELPENNKLPKCNTFDPISVSNSFSQAINMDTEITNEELLTMIKDINIIQNAPLGNSCTGMDLDLLSLLSVQDNTLPMDVSVESILAEIKNNHVTLLGSEMNYDPLKELNQKNEVDTYFPKVLENNVSNAQLHTTLHNNVTS